MPDQPAEASELSQVKSSTARGMARELAFEAAVNMLLDGQGRTGKTHVDIDPSAGDTARVVTHHEGGATKAGNMASAGWTMKDDAKVLNVVQGTGPHGPNPDARVVQDANGSSVVLANGIGRPESVTSLTITPQVTLFRAYNFNGDTTQFWGKRCLESQNCDTAVLDAGGKLIAITKTELLHDSPSSRLLKVDVFKVESDKSQTKLGDFHFLERQQHSKHISLDINVQRVHERGK